MAASVYTYSHGRQCSGTSLSSARRFSSSALSDILNGAEVSRAMPCACRRDLSDETSLTTPFHAPLFPGSSRRRSASLSLPLLHLHNKDRRWSMPHVDIPGYLLPAQNVAAGSSSSNPDCPSPQAPGVRLVAPIQSLQSTSQPRSPMPPYVVSNTPPPTPIVGQRSPSPEYEIPMQVRSSWEKHTLQVYLPGFQPEMVTISVKKGNSLAVVADLWHLETNCHHEWLVHFPSPDADMSSVRAVFSNDGTLTIDVPRHLPFAR